MNARSDPTKRVDAGDAPSAIHKRGRSLRRSLATTLIAVSVLSVLLLGILNFVGVREVLTDSIASQLTNQQTAKAAALRNGLDRIEQSVVLVARGEEVVDAAIAFSEAFDALNAQAEILEPAQAEAVDEFYKWVDGAISASGLEAIGWETPAPGELLPATDTAKYLQYHYIVTNPSEERRDLIEAASDDSLYGEVHAEHHPRLAELTTELGFGDLLLVDDEGNVVYSSDKRLDFATNTRSGPYRESGMATAVTTRLAAAPVGDAVFVDFEIYLPGGGSPSMFVAAAVRQDARTVGAVLVEVPIASLNTLTTNGRDWESAGLGDTGEVYIVGSDSLMRSDSRLWIEDPEEYQSELESANYAPEIGSLIATFDSTVLIQPVRTEAVVAAFDGEAYLGRTSNYLEVESLTSAGPVGADQVDWVVVADLASSEAGSPLRSYVTRLLVAAAILIPLVGLVGWFLADRMTRPIKPVVAAAAAVADGHLDTTLPDLGRNEVGDVARRLGTLTGDLRSQEDAIAEEEREITKLLLSALPRRLVEQLRSGQRTLRDLADTTTVIALTVTGVLDEAGIDSESAVAMGAKLSTNLEAVADRLGIERVRSSSDQHIFAAGLDLPEPAAADAATFVLEAVAAIEEFAADLGIEVTSRAGMSAGEVIAGVLSVEQLTYGVFGDPPRRALALNATAGPGEILVDNDTAALLGDGWSLVPVKGLLDLQGEPVTAQLLTGGPKGAVPARDSAEYTDEPG